MSRIKRWLEDEDGNLRIPEQDELDAFYIPKMDPWSASVVKDKNNVPVALQPKGVIGVYASAEDLGLDTYPTMPVWEAPEFYLPSISNEGVGSVAWKGVKALARWIAKVFSWLVKALEAQSLRQFHAVSLEAQRVRVSLRGAQPPTGPNFEMSTHGKALSYRYRNLQNVTGLLSQYQSTQEVALEFFKYYYKVLIPAIRKILPVLRGVVRQPSTVERLTRLVGEASPAQLRRSIITSSPGNEVGVSQPLLGSMYLELRGKDDRRATLKLSRDNSRFQSVSQKFTVPRFGLSQAERLLSDVDSFGKSVHELSKGVKNSEVSGYVKELQTLTEQLASAELSEEDERHVPEIVSSIRSLIMWINTPFNGFTGNLLTTNRGCIRLCVENYRS